MIWTPQSIAKLSEARLRQEVLLPLFEAMGFRAVEHYHGGSLEQGKDIVMWKSDELGARVNYAVVAKAGRITGKASGRSGAGEVFVQGREALGSTYVDSVTMVRYHIDRIWIVASGPIFKEAYESICNAFSELERKLVRIINGDELWGLVERHLATRAIYEQLGRVRAALAGASEHHEIVGSTGPDGLRFTVVPKHDAADTAEPLIFNLELSFPDNEEGRAASAELAEHFRTGKQARISQQYIRTMKVPSFLEPHLGLDQLEGAELRIGPTKLPEPIPVRVRLGSDADEEMLFPYARMECVQTGHEESTFEARPDNLCWTMRLIVNWPSRTLNVTFSAKYAGEPVEDVQRGLLVQRRLAEGGGVRMENLSKGLVTDLGEMPKGVIESPSDELVDFVKALVCVRDATGIRMSYPDDHPSEKDYLTALQLAEVFQTGRRHLSLREIAFPMMRDGAERVVELFGSGQSHSLWMRKEERANLLGNELDLGPVVLVYPGAHLLPDDAAALRRSLADSKQEGPFRIKFRLGRGSPTQAYYEKWLPEDERGRVPGAAEQETGFSG